MAFPLKNGVDLYTNELLRARLHNFDGDLAEHGVGSIYFNTTEKLNTSDRVRYRGQTAWHSVANLEDVERLENLISDLGEVSGGNITSVLNRVITLEEAYNAFFKGEADADAVLENLKEIQRFLDTYDAEMSLSDQFNAINDKIDEVANKATKVSVSGLLESGKSIGTIKVDETSYNLLAPDDYLPLSGGTITGGFGSFNIMRDGEKPSSIRFVNTSTALGAIGFNASSSPCIWDGSGTNERRLLHEGNYSSILDDVYLKKSGGTISSVYNEPLVIHNSNTASGSYIVFKSGDIKKAYFGYSGADYAFIQYGDSSVLGIKSDGVYYNNYRLLHSGNFNFYVPTLTGTGASGTWGIDITGAATALKPTLTRPSTANVEPIGDGSVRSFLVTSLMTEGKPHDDAAGTILSFYWDSVAKYTRQLFIGAEDAIDSPNKRLAWRTQDGHHWSDWKTVAFTDSTVAAAKVLVSEMGGLVLKAENNNRLTDWQGVQMYESGETGITSYPKYSLFGSSDGDVATVVQGGELIALKTASLERLWVNSSGNVTIGRSDLASTTWKFYVDGLSRLGATVMYGQLDLFNANDAKYVTSIVTGTVGLYIQSRQEGVGWTNIIMNERGGSVGIGTADPQYKLDVNGIIRAARSIMSYAKDGYSQVELLYGDNTGWVLSQRGAETSKDFGIYTLVNGVDTCRFRIKENGNVGIGVITPYQKLHVAGNILLRNYDSIRFFKSDGTTQVESLTLNSDNEVVLGGDANYYGLNTIVKGYRTIIKAGTYNTSALIIDENCNAAIPHRLLVGNPTDSGWIPFQVKGATDIDGPLYISAHSKEGIYFNENGIHWHNTAAGWVSALMEFSSCALMLHQHTTINGDLKVTGNIIADGQISSGGVAEAGTGGATGGSGLERVTFTIPANTTSFSCEHNLATKEISVSIYEDGNDYQQVLTDVYLDNDNTARIVFGSATDVVHKVVIIG